MAAYSYSCPEKKSKIYYNNRVYRKFRVTAYTNVNKVI